LFDFGRRIKELENDGIVGDVVINQFFPFADGGLIPGTRTWDRPHRRTGMRAANRWLADRCSSNPGRHAGLAVIPDMDDIAASVKELESLFDAGLRGGVMLPDSPSYEWPAWNDPRYTPLWEFLDHHGLAVHTHLGSNFGGPSTDLRGDGSIEINIYENHFRASRPFWAMYFGRVFERYPNIKFSFTEHGIEWIPEMIRHMMVSFYKGLMALEEQLAETPAQWEGHDLKPDEVWQRQGFAGGSFMAKGEADMRDEIGVDQMMWGSDYPHVEGTWPNTRKKLQRVLQDVPLADKRKILGENALRCYPAAFDEAHLRTEAARTGLTTSEV
jgi:predicted TIM-barrel fold metal-dependent hydrolase